MSRVSDFRAHLPDAGMPIGTRRLVGKTPPRYSAAFTVLIDIAAITLTCVLSTIAYKGVIGDIGDLTPAFGIGFYSAIFFALLMNTRGLYSLQALASFSRQWHGLAGCWSLVLVGLLSSFFLLKVGAEFSRGAMIIFGVGGGLAVLVIRLIASRQIAAGIQRGTLVGRRAIVIGTLGELSSSFIGGAVREYGATDVEYFSLPQEPETPDNSDQSIVNEAIRFSVANRIELVLVLLPWAGSDRMKGVFQQLRALPVQVLLLPDRVVNSVLARPGETFAGQVAVEIQRAPLMPVELLLKRSCDLIFASVSLVLLSPLLAAVACLIKLDSTGPVIFRQKRRGFNGREFSIFKFRTMNVLENSGRIRQAERNDNRVTRLGRVLRRSSIDELPQLFNVLRGEMSIVGPRPHAVAHDNTYSRLIENYAFRHHVKPGITGWAQVHGLRGQTDQSLMQDRVDRDLWYINNWSLLLDIKIIALTFVEVARQRNAY